MDETNSEHFFRQGNITKMKRFLDGRGWAVDRKFGEVGLIYQEACIVLTSNTLPFDRMSTVDREAFEQRVKTVYLKKQPHRLTETFPLNAIQLATFLMDNYE